MALTPPARVPANGTCGYRPATKPASVSRKKFLTTNTGIAVIIVDTAVLNMASHWMTGGIGGSWMLASMDASA